MAVGGGEGLSLEREGRRREGRGRAAPGGPIKESCLERRLGLAVSLQGGTYQEEEQRPALRIWGIVKRRNE